MRTQRRDISLLCLCTQDQIAANRNVRVSDLATPVNKGRQHGGLSSAIRLFVLDHYRAKVDGRADAR
jgi:predicted DNA-binding ribbon-helix-helix protein